MPLRAKQAVIELFPGHSRTHGRQPSHFCYPAQYALRQPVSNHLFVSHQCDSLSWRITAVHMDARRGRIAAQSASCRIRVNGAPTFTLAFYTFFCIYMCVQKVVMVLGNLSHGNFGKLFDNETTRQKRTGDWKLFFCFYFIEKAIQSYIFF